MTQKTVATPGGQLAPAGIIGGLSNLKGTAAAAGAGTSGGMAFLSYKKGAWYFGAEADTPDEDAQAILDVTSFQHGVIRFYEERGVMPDKKLVPLSEPLPTEADLPAPNPAMTSKGCNVQVGVVFNGVSSNLSGVKLIFETSSKGGISALENIGRQVETRASEGLDYCPVIAFGTGGYKHPSHGFIHTPDLEIVGWVPAPGAEPAPERLESAPEPAPEPEPTPEPEAAPEPATPLTRRRRNVT